MERYEQMSKEKLIGQLKIYKGIVDNLPQKVFFKDENYVFQFVNENFSRDFGIRPEEMIGKGTLELFPKYGKKYIEDDRKVIEAEELLDIEEKYIQDGQERWVHTIKTPLRDEQGNLMGLLGIFRDITEKKMIQNRMKQQAKEIIEMALPVIQVWPGIAVAPIIGTLDSQRTQRVMETLLNFIVSTGSRIALLDITGVPTVDTATAQHLIDTVRAVRLLGAKVVVTGMSPQIAQTIVHLGIDLSEIVSCSSLADGVGIALEELNLTIGPAAGKN